MRVPEIWRHNGKMLRFCLLQSNGEYADSETSGVFPFLRPEHLMPFLSIKDNVDETTRIRNFIRWLRASGP